MWAEKLSKTIGRRDMNGSRVGRQMRTCVLWLNLYGLRSGDSDKCETKKEEKSSRRSHKTLFGNQYCFHSIDYRQEGVQCTHSTHACVHSHTENTWERGVVRILFTNVSWTTFLAKLSAWLAKLRDSTLESRSCEICMQFFLLDTKRAKFLQFFLGKHARMWPWKKRKPIADSTQKTHFTLIQMKKALPYLDLEVFCL